MIASPSIYPRSSGHHYHFHAQLLVFIFNLLQNQSFGIADFNAAALMLEPGSDARTMDRVVGGGKIRNRNAVCPGFHVHLNIKFAFNLIFHSSVRPPGLKTILHPQPRKIGKNGKKSQIRFFASVFRAVKAISIRRDR